MAVSVSAVITKERKKSGELVHRKSEDKEEKSGVYVGMRRQRESAE